MNNKYNKKRIRFWAGVCGCAVITALVMPVMVMANTGSRKANIKSTGNIDFEDGKVYITSSDLTYLADEIDTLEDTYKTTTVDALNSIGTYFKNDGSITYDSNQNETDTEEEKTRLSFGNIMDGIKNSQSVVSVSSMQATDKAGNLLYYVDETAQANQDVSSTTTTDTGYPVYYKAATAENLSAGTAAWVNGKLIQGNGSDNAAYVEQINTQISQGTATSDTVLNGYSFSSNVGINIQGTMQNQGILNWNPSSATTYTIPAGYYSGGTLSSANAYNAGYNDGYSIGYQAGIDAAIKKGTLYLTVWEHSGGYNANIPKTVSFTIYSNSNYQTGEIISYEGAASAKIVWD